MPVDLVEFAQRLGLLWSRVDAFVIAAVGVFLVCLVVVVIDAFYLSVSAQRDQNDSRNLA